jgi:hypothetical protein
MEMIEYFTLSLSFFKNKSIAVIDSLIKFSFFILQVRVLYTRKVNPNRTHVSTDLTVDADGNSKVSES